MTSLFWKKFSMPRHPRGLLGHLKSRQLSWHARGSDLNLQPKDEWVNWIKQANSQEAAQLWLRLFTFTAPEAICCGDWRLCYLWGESLVEEDPAKCFHILWLPLSSLFAYLTPHDLVLPKPWPGSCVWEVEDIHFSYCPCWTSAEGRSGNRWVNLGWCRWWQGFVHFFVCVSHTLLQRVGRDTEHP